MEKLPNCQVLHPVVHSKLCLQGLQLILLSNYVGISDLNPDVYIPFVKLRQRKMQIQLSPS